MRALRTKLTVAGAVASALVLLVSGVASAAPGDYISGDPTGGVINGFAADLSTWVWTYGFAALVSLVIIGIMFRMALRFIKRGAAQI